MIEAFVDLRKFHQGFADANTCLTNTIGVETCISGCGKCCEHNIARSMTIEAILANSMLAGTGKLRKALTLAEGWLLERDSKLKIYEGLSRVKDTYITPQLRQELDIVTYGQCPFLTEKKQCLVHDVRPLVCRAYGVTRAVSSWYCPRKIGKGESVTQHQYIAIPELKKDIHDFRQYHTIKHPEWTLSGFFATLLFRAGNEKKFREYVSDNKIASAKLVGTQIETSLMWQSDEEEVKPTIPSYN